MIYDLEAFQRGSLSAEAVGYKALNLARLSLAGGVVPRFICVGTQAFDQALATEQGREVQEFLNSYLLNKVGLYLNLEAMREAILGLHLAAITLSLLGEKLRLNGMSGPFAVRSSARFEDRAQHSGAGAYETSLNVPEASLPDAILRCWASLYSPRAFLQMPQGEALASDLKMAVIIQEMVAAEVSGVLFTANPVASSRMEMVIEAGRGLGDQLVSGEAAVARYYYNRVQDQVHTEPSLDAVLSEAQVRQLASLGAEVERILGGPQDIEWAMTDGRVHLLQSRPITTLSSERLEAMKLFAFHELNDELAEHLGQLRVNYSRWQRKKIHLYRACQRRGVPNCGWWFVRYTAPLLGLERLAQLQEQIVAPFLFLAVNEHIIDIHIPVHDLADTLLRLADLHGDRPLTVSLRESLPNDVSILANLTEDGNVYLEYIPGALKGINSGMLIPSTLLVTPTGQILQHQRFANDFYYRFDLERLDFVPCYAWETPALSTEDLLIVARGTLALTEAFEQRVVVEWWKWGSVLKVSDASLPKSRSLPAEARPQRYTVISPGALEGRVLNVDYGDLESLAYLSHGRGISVLDYKDGMNSLRLLQQARQRIRSWKAQGDKVLLYLPRPYLIFAPLSEEVDGFLFQQASLLCHLSIILREKGIPALSFQGESRSFEDGEWFRCEAGD
ncbi:MAG TPA: PEP/pyruvate-binding domain-containing protein [Anaerolineae bacterium]|nr:PEP/pyruvate-binding domain-containing protein [Anaerolineae bacterium]